MSSPEKQLHLPRRELISALDGLVLEATLTRGLAETYFPIYSPDSEHPLVANLPYREQEYVAHVFAADARARLEDGYDANPQTAWVAVAKDALQQAAEVPGSHVNKSNYFYRDKFADDHTELWQRAMDRRAMDEALDEASAEVYASAVLFGQIVLLEI